MGHGKKQQARRRRRQRRQRASEAAAARAAAPRTPTAVQVTQEMLFERLMQSGMSREEVLALRDTAMDFVRNHPDPAALVDEMYETASRPTDRMYTSVDEMEKASGGVDVHVWHEVWVDGAFKIYGIPGGVDGDAPEFNKQHPDAKCTHRCAYSQELQQQVFDRFMKHQVEDAERVAAKSPEQVELIRECILTDNNGAGWLRWCMRRAAMLMVAFPETFNRSTLRIGAAGWRREDGAMHWEYG